MPTLSCSQGVTGNIGWANWIVTNLGMEVVKLLKNVSTMIDHDHRVEDQWAPEGHEAYDE